MKVILGADHGGFEMKEKIKVWLAGKGYGVTDVGAMDFSAEDDFVDYAKAAVKEIESIEDRVVLFCRNGFGMCIAANRLGVRCGLAFDVEAVRKGRMDDDINSLSVPADYVEEGKLKEMIEVFLEENFSGEEKYKRRLLRLDSIL